jgi:hypothetical protein
VRGKGAKRASAQRDALTAIGRPTLSVPAGGKRGMGVWARHTEIKFQAKRAQRRARASSVSGENRIFRKAKSNRGQATSYLSLSLFPSPPSPAPAPLW